MKLRILLCVPLLLVACEQDVRDLRLDEIDLTDMAEVQRLGEGLSPAERPAFTTFVALHGRTAGNCGLTLGGRRDREPATIGEAIEAMQVRLAQVRRESATATLASRPPSAQAGAYDGPSLAEVERELAVLEK